MLKQYIYILLSLFLTAAFSACQDDQVLEAGEQEIVAGEKVMFSSYIPEVGGTRSAQTDFQDGIKSSYKAVGQEYTFTIKMYKQGVDAPVGSAQYKPTVNASATGYMDDGTLTWNNTGSPLYWDDNVNRYGFEATAGTETLATNQKTQTSFLAQDRLHGYAYEPLWEGDPDAGRETDRIDMLNYRTSREWYLANQQVYENFGQMPIGSDEYKTVPLFLQHERAMITVILKADEGVSRDQLKHATSDENIETHIISYGGTETTIDPLPENTYIDYNEQDYGGAATHVETMAYHAIVEPYNYLTTADEKPLCTINLSGQKFSYYASNDKDYIQYATELETVGNVENLTGAEAKRVANAYNLTAGKHLIITATLSRESRKIVITAYVEDWTEKVTTSICDDYGKNGDPETIRTREELIAFLDNPNKNKAGTVAIISPTVLDLEKTITTDDNGNITNSTPAAWPTSKKLNCMLNLAGAVIYTEHELFSEMASSANLVNGTIVVRKNTNLSAVVTEKNEGTIERVDVRPEALSEDDPATASIAKVNKAGLVNQNYGTIFQCSSSIPVQGTTGYVGGIAAESLKDAQSSKSPVISDCTVAARVDGTDITAGGGIVGNATGRVTGNTFSYGMTVLQTDVFKNIIGQSCETTEAPLTVSNNSWPTTVLNDIAGTNANENAIYSGVIDRQEELAYVLKSSTYNVNASKILMAADFAVNSEYWGEQNLGKQDATLSGITNGNVFFELDGNDKMITLKGTKPVTVDDTTYPTSAMLFTNIQNNIHDLTLVVEESLIAEPSSNTDPQTLVTSFDGLDAIAPLGYSVYGATLSNIKVKTAEGKYIQAAMPGGIVAWAYGNAVINQCEFMGKIQTWLPASVGSSSLRFAGGIAASAEVATFNQCMFHTSTGTLVESAHEHHTIYAGGIVGGIYKRDNNSQATPLVTIKDCASQFSETDTYKGAIVGRAQYDTNSTGANQHANGLNSEQCEGNWWGSTSRAVGQTYNYMTDIKALGARNSVDPTFNAF